jgi:DNA-binding transcriptional MerR regulator
VSARTYLSIGDVLTLLREEFPDVTISKIRFLESQGLVNPERSPSGYRKFFDHDVERLRWVLRQQREHFLPLKVIRDRLADGELDDAGAEAQTGQRNGKEAAPTRAAQPVHAAAGAASAARAAGGPALPGEEPTKADEEAMARILADASRRTALLPEDAQARRGLQVLTEEMPAAAGMQTAVGTRSHPSALEPHAQARRSGKGAAAPATPAREPAGPGAGSAGGRGAAGAATTGATRGSGGSGGSGATNGTSRRGDESPSRTGSSGGQGGGRKGPAHAAAGAGESGAPDASPVPSAVVTGVSLTAEELAGASGLSLEEVAGLVSFGLIEPVLVAGIATYDEDALTLANLAASFRVYGIEPRHLRMYRNAVDREIGLIEQVVIPLLRQRNPESRQRAVEAAEELGTLGQSMRATLLRQGLRKHLGG